MAQTGDKVGNISVLELIGEGGMGDVFLGFDEKLERRVALKAIRRDRLEPENQARLLAEARVLSQLDHPHICRIFEYLEQEEDHFLVLEFIEGKELRAKLEEDLDLPARLRIAEQVAQALIAAHGQGVVHRDLKPANVMITPTGEVKVLDFGLARSGPRRHEVVEGESSPNMGELTRGASAYYQTQLGAVVGTAESMSPEQARGEPATAASDMYSFGLMLQEILTGSPAYELGLRPDLLITKAAEGDTLPITGQPPDITVLVESLKSLSPSARPSAAEALRTLRHIRDKPRRRLRRLAAAVAVLAVLFAGFKYTFDLRAERTAAVEARQEAEQVVELLVGLFETSDPTRAEGERLDARQILDRGAEKVRHELSEQPRTQARLLDTLGRIYTRLGLYDQAAPLLEEGLAARRRLTPGDPLEVAGSLQHLADLEYQRQAERTGDLYQEALSIREQELGPSHPKVADSAYGLGSFYAYRGRLAEAQEQFQRSLDIREAALGPRHPSVAESLKNLGGVILFQGDAETAEGLLHRALGIQEEALGPNHPKVAEITEALAVLCAQQERNEESIRYHLRALEIWRESFGPQHPMVAMVLSNLGSVYSQEGRLDEAEEVLQQALGLREEQLGPEHPSVAYTLVSLAGVYSGREQFSEAEPLYRRALGILEASLGSEHSRTVGAKKGLVELLRATDRDAEATILESGSGEEAEGAE